MVGLALAMEEGIKDLFVPSEPSIRIEGKRSFAGCMA
jgi:hypothetical protein